MLKFIFFDAPWNAFWSFVWLLSMIFVSVIAPICSQTIFPLCIVMFANRNRLKFVQFFYSFIFSLFIYFCYVFLASKRCGIQFNFFGCTEQFCNGNKRQKKNIDDYYENQIEKHINFRRNSVNFLFCFISNISFANSSDCVVEQRNQIKWKSNHNRKWKKNGNISRERKNFEKYFGCCCWIWKIRKNMVPTV